MPGLDDKRAWLVKLQAILTGTVDLTGLTKDELEESGGSVSTKAKFKTGLKGLGSLVGLSDGSSSKYQQLLDELTALEGTPHDDLDPDGVALLLREARACADRAHAWMEEHLIAWGEAVRTPERDRSDEQKRVVKRYGAVEDVHRRATSLAATLQEHLEAVQARATLAEQAATVVPQAEAAARTGRSSAELIAHLDFLDELLRKARAVAQDTRLDLRTFIGPVQEVRDAVAARLPIVEAAEEAVVFTGEARPTFTGLLKAAGVSEDDLLTLGDDNVSRALSTDETGLGMQAARLFGDARRITVTLLSTGADKMGKEGGPTSPFASGDYTRWLRTRTVLGRAAVLQQVAEMLAEHDTAPDQLYKPPMRERDDGDPTPIFDVEALYRTDRAVFDLLAVQEAGIEGGGESTAFLAEYWGGTPRETLFKTYIERGAPRQINIDSSDYKRIADPEYDEQVKARRRKPRHTDPWDGAVESICSMVNRDNLPRFYRWLRDMG